MLHLALRICGIWIFNAVCVMARGRLINEMSV